MKMGMSIFWTSVKTSARFLMNERRFVEKKRATQYKSSDKGIY